MKVFQINSNQIEISWSRPSAINGYLIAYNLYRNTILLTNMTQSKLFNSNRLTFMDNFSVMPKTLYKYEIFVCNEAGCASSSNFIQTVLSRDEACIKVDAPVLVSVSTNQALISGLKSVHLKSPSTQTITNYLFYLNDSLVYNGSRSEVKLFDLKPNTLYSVRLGACTFLSASNDGCLNSSDTLLFKTNQSRPEDLTSIKFEEIPIDDYFLNLKLKWNLPKRPNGMLNLIELKRDNFIIYLSRVDHFSLNNYLHTTSKIIIIIIIIMINIIYKIFIFKNETANNYQYVDQRLNYGKNYSYQLTFYNDAGPSTINSLHFTSENVSIEKRLAKYLVQIIFNFF
jgi:hypothetical protein